MASPVSVVVAEIVMQNNEEQAVATYRETLPLWLRYVWRSMYNHCCTQKQNRWIPRTLEQNRIQASILPRRSRRTVKIPFLDYFVTHLNNCLQETNTHWQTTWQNVFQSYFTQSEPLREEHRLFATHTTVWSTNSSTWTLFLSKTITAQTSSNALLTSDWTTALTTHTPLQPLYLTYEGPLQP